MTTPEFTISERLERPPSHIEVSVEWARKLKAAGFPQKAHWFWIEYCDNPEKRPDRIEYFLWGANRQGENTLRMNGRTHLDSFAAPTAEEILRRLPEWVIYKQHPKAAGAKCYISITLEEQPGLFTMRLKRKNSASSGQMGLGSSRHKATKYMTKADTLANASAAMYVYLAQQGLLPTP